MNLGPIIGLIGGIVGSIIGIAGGLLGTYFTIKSAKGPQERAFVIKASIACWIFVLAFVLGMCLIPGLYKLFLVPIYVIGLVAGILLWNKKQARIRFAESKQKPAVPCTEIIPRKCPQCGAELRPDVSEGLCPACLLQRGIATEGGAPPGTPPFTPPTIPDLARLFPQLEILELIGKGGMGAVYKARQPALDRFVALKILAPRSGGDLDFAERFTREARALARLSHPNIVAVYDFGQAGGLSYFIMEFVDGPNLRQVEQAGRLSPREALEIIPQICGALQFAHDEGIVHRDIKPENVLLDKKGRVKIADFGLAKILGSEPKDFRLTGARDVVGTPHYMAPEQIEKPSAVDHRADIYSLGVVFYEMLTGELPLGKFQPPSACARGMQIDVRLDEVVLHALEKEPARRYQHVSEVKTRVETIAMTSRGSGQEPAPSESQSGLAPAATASPLRRGVRAGLGVFLAVVILAAGITFLLPESYVGIARVKLAGASPQNYDPYRVMTEFEVIESSVVLKPVADSLNLGGRWSKIFAGSGGTLPDDEVVELMKRQLALQPLRNTSIFEIRYYSQSPKEAAEIANKISEVYCALFPGHRGEIIDPATVPLRPVRPNRPLNLFIGAVAGAALGIFTGVTVGLLAFWRGRAARRTISPPPMQKTDRFWRFIVIVFVVIPTLGLLGELALKNLTGKHHDVPTTAQTDQVGELPSPTSQKLQQQVIDAEAQINKRTAQLRELSKLNNNQLRAVMPDLIPDFSLQRLLADLDAAQRQLKILGTTNRSDPKAEQLNDYIAVLNRKIDERVQGLLSGLKAQLESQKAAVRQVQQQLAATNPAPVSAETWSPTIAPDEKPDLQKILDEAKTFMEQHKYEESLQRHLWHFNHAAEFGDSYQSVVRLTSGLSDWEELGRRYPKAKQALMEIRDSRTQQLAAGQGYSEMLHEVQAINHELQDDDATVALIKTIHAKDPKLTGQNYFWMEDLLLQKGEYDLLLDCMGDPQAHFGSARRGFEMQIQSQQRMEEMRKQHPVPVPRLPGGAFTPPDLGQMATNNFVGQVCKLVEILVATGHQADAEKIRDQAVVVLDDARLKSAVSDARLKIQKPETIQTLAEQPPVVVETWPVSGAHDVEPGVAEIRVRFSKEMADGGWSWSTAWDNSAPESIGDPHYEAGQRTCVLKVKLEPGRTYAWWLNSGKFHGFTDLAGRRFRIC